LPTSPRPCGGRWRVYLLGPLLTTGPGVGERALPARCEAAHGAARRRCSVFPQRRRGAARARRREISTTWPSSQVDLPGAG